MNPNITSKTRLPLLVGVCVLCSGSAYAGCGNSPSYLDQVQLNTILSGNFACGQSTALNPPGWNERHAGAPGGSLVEQHEGGTSVETVGTWTTSLVGGRGRVTYSYAGGTSPVYEVAAVANGNCSPSCATLPQTYEFCGVGGGAPATLTIRITTASISPPLSSCPTNP